MTAAYPVASRAPDRTGMRGADRSAPSQCGVVTGPGFSSPNQPDQMRTTAYHDSSGPDSQSDAHSAIIVGGWENPSGESRSRLLRACSYFPQPGSASMWRTSRPKFALVIFTFLFVSCATPSPYGGQRELTDHSSFRYSDESSQTAFVIIHRGNPAYLWFEGVPKGTSAGDLQRARTYVATTAGASIVSWAEFRELLPGIIAEIGRVNDYPDYNIQEGLACLIGKAHGPWGLTWNGGIALTYMDYTHAEERFEAYKHAPQNYSPIENRRLDANNPGGFFLFFECQ